MEFELDQVKVGEILGEFEISNVSISQRGIIAELVTILSEYTGIPDKTMMGFVYITILSWQNENDEEIKVLENYSPEDREKVLDILVEKLKFMLRALLVRPGQWQKLEEGLDTSYERYREKWKHR